MKRYVILAILFCLFAGQSISYSQTSKDPGNMYTIWRKLALVGKNQAEIEYYFRNIDDKTMERVKGRIRFAVLESLRRTGIKGLIKKITDEDDLNVIINTINTEIRYAGMEHDDDLRLSIKEEFGVQLENL